MRTRNQLKAKLISGENTVGLSCMIGNPQIVEEFAMTDIDYIYIDQQHGLISHERLVQMLQAMGPSTATPLVRVPGNDEILIGQALDAGAQGVIVPMIDDAQAAAKAARATRYFPQGSRSWGPIRALHGLGTDPAHVNNEVLCFVMIETAKGVENVDAIVSTPGVDGVYIGPADLSVSMGSPPLGIEHITDKAPLEAIRQIQASCQKHGKTAAITGHPENRHPEGFSMVTANSDIGLIRSSLAALQPAVH